MQLLLLLTAVLLASCSGDGRSGGAQGNTSDLEVDADLIVVGAGVAGISAALEASSLDKRVLVIEMASIFGGHALISGGGLSLSDTEMQRAQGIEDSAELMYQDMRAWSSDFDQSWAGRYAADSSTEVYDWVVEHGVNFTFIGRPPGNSVPRMHFPDTLGHGLMMPLLRAALQSKQIRFEFNQRADGLIIESGAVHGVRTTNMRSGEEGKFYSHAVLLATGGFQSNLNKVRQYWGNSLPVPDRILAGSGVYSLGLGLDVATDAGAQLQRMDYMWNYVAGIPDPRDASGERGLRIFIDLGLPRPDIWLNADGERFVNECLSPKYSLPKILEQPGGNHWLFFDNKARPLISIAGSGWTPEKMQRQVFDKPEIAKMADSLNDLAVLMDVPSEKLQTTVERYNGFLNKNQDQDFRRFGEDSDPRGGCDVADAIDTPPYFAIKRYPLARKSMGGLAIDEHGRVTDLNGQLIPGLYAAGEVTGFAGVNGTAALEGTFLGPSIYTGRIAGRAAVAESMDLTSASWPLVRSEATSTSDPAYVGPRCNGCHPIAELAAGERPGYMHFEWVHRRVAELNLSCADCHEIMSPYRPVTHRINYSHLIGSCVHCHGSGQD